MKTLLGIYVYTCIDYLPAFYKKGNAFGDSFVALANLDLPENITADIEEFTCHMYGYPKNKCIYGVLSAEFNKKCKPKPGKNPLDCIKFGTPATLQPCSKVLLQQIKRAGYIATSLLKSL